MENFHSLIFKQRYKAIAAGILVQDTAGKVVYANLAASQILGLSPEEICEKAPAASDWIAIDIEGNSFTQENHPITATLATGKCIYNAVHGIYHGKTGELRWLLTNSKPVVDSLSNQVTEAVITFLDITELKNSQQELLAKNLVLEELASTDRLTGLRNRHYFETTALREIERSKRYYLPLSLLLFDIDHFKRINDYYGHQMGDEVLIKVSQLIQKQLRINDLFARWGGDEFIILLPNSPLQAALQTAEKIRALIETYDFSPIEKVTLSIGTAEFSADQTMGDWIKRADEALYLAKNSGRNTVKSTR